MKKLISILLALAMVLSMATAALADEVTPSPNSSTSGKFGVDKGSITINKYNPSNEYAIYRMLNLESFDTAGKGSYSYRVNDGWAAFFAENGAGRPYVDINDAGYVTWKANQSEAAVIEFSQKALAYAQDTNNGVAAIAVSDSKNTQNIGTITDNDGKEYKTYTFSELDLGYYLVDSTMGALCGLTTTNLNASINAKNGEPTMELQVKEDATGQWTTANTDDMGATIEYRATITTSAGAQNYAFHNQMAAGLTFKADSVQVYYDGAQVAADNYDVIVAADSNAACISEDNSCKNGCTFVVKFKDSFTSTMAANKSLLIYFDAMLNEHAVVAGDGNTDKAVLAFGDDHFTAEASVATKTYAFDLVKTDAQNTLLGGAFFTMNNRIKVVNGETTSYDLKPINLVKVVVDNKNTEDTSDDTFYYRPAIDTDSDDSIVDGEFEVVNGMIRFQGFDSDEYAFVETKAPDGYNQLTAPAVFSLPESNKDAMFNNGVYSSGSGFHITNQSGTMLPETGAMGTTMFIFFGTFMVLAAGVLLVTKKRMTMIED